MGSQTLFPIADLHTHPMLPMYYYGKNLRERLPNARFFPYTPWGTHIDVPRLRESGVKLIVCCVYAFNRGTRRNCFEVAKEQIRLFEKWVSEHAEILGHAKNPAEAETIVASGKIAAVLSLEGGHHLAGNLENLRYFRDKGVFYITLVHFLNTAVAESSLLEDFSPEPPLRPFGRDVIAEMDRLGMVSDVAHCSEAAFWRVLETARVPPLYSHGCAHSLCGHHRNLRDDQARALARRGGLVGVIFYPRYLRRGAFWGTVADVIRHLEHWLKIIGPEAVAIGSDMNGVMVLKDVFDYSQMPVLRQAVVDAFGETLARKILFDNTLNYMKRAWAQVG